MSAPSAVKNFPVRRYVFMFAVILVVALFPLFSVFLTYLVADANGCQVNEAYVQPCVVLGADLGALLYTMGVLGWLMLATIPFGALALGLLFVVLLAHLFWWRHAKTKVSRS